ncbi:MAG: transposase, partial [Nitrospirae bacterium]|nr:transposase [Nitrospirota bacterium]
YVYVLMNNHVHLLIETRKTPLSKILQGINQSYTVYFNRKYNTSGHLFQGRYKAILCDKDKYLLALVKYIHLNPVRAKIVKSPDEYRWSSHQSYVRRSDKNDIIDEDQVLRMFSDDKSKARKLYTAFISEGIPVKKEDIYLTIDQRILGEEEFADKIMEKCNADIGHKRREKEYTLSQIAMVIEKTYGITRKQMREKGKDREISLCRKVLCLVADEYGHKGKDIAGYIHKDPAMISRHLKEKADLKEETEKLIQVLKKNVRTNVNSQA